MASGGEGGGGGVGEGLAGSEGQIKLLPFQSEVWLNWKPDRDKRDR